MVDLLSAEELLAVWERGRGLPQSGRALLLAEAADAVGRCTIGECDRRLLDLREAMFGGEMPCLFDCAACGGVVEFTLAVADLRLPYGDTGDLHEIAVDGHVVGFRVPAWDDVADLGGASGPEAERRLLALCVVAASRGDAPVAADELPDAIAEAVSARLAEIDAQAQIRLDLACPACSNRASAAFDIVGHLWAEFDARSRQLLREVHVLACSYGWSEAAILAMSPTRRRVYIEFVDA